MGEGVRNQQMSQPEPIIPDNEALERVARDYPDKSDAEKYRLAQADTLIRLAKAKDMDELNRMSDSGLIDKLIEDHNARMRAALGR
jgi:hypothetical protein